LDYRVSLHFSQDVQYFIILIYFSIVILNFNYQLSISCWIDCCWGKKFKISTQKCSLFLSIILSCPLVKICFHFPFLSVKAIVFNHIIIYIIWNYLHSSCNSSSIINQCLHCMFYNNIIRVHIVYIINNIVLIYCIINYYHIEVFRL